MGTRREYESASESDRLPGERRDPFTRASKHPKLITFASPMFVHLSTPQVVVRAPEQWIVRSHLMLASRIALAQAHALVRSSSARPFRALLLSDSTRSTELFEHHYSCALCSPLRSATHHNHCTHCSMNMIYEVQYVESRKQEVLLTFCVVRVLRLSPPAPGLLEVNRRPQRRPSKSLHSADGGCRDCTSRDTRSRRTMFAIEILSLHFSLIISRLESSRIHANESVPN